MVEYGWCIFLLNCAKRAYNQYFRPNLVSKLVVSVNALVESSTSPYLSVDIQIRPKYVEFGPDASGLFEILYINMKYI